MNFSNNNTFMDNQVAMVNGNEKLLRVTKMILIETPTYNTQYRRPYHTQIDGKTINDLNEIAAGNHTYLPSMVAAAAGNVIMPSAQAEASINIVNGWDTRRMRWMMDVETRDTLGQVVMEKVIGYTDHAGITNTGNLDPQMTFIIDGITTCTKCRVRTDYGMQESIRVVDTSSVMADNEFSGVNYVGSKHLLRPSDIFSTVSVAHLSDDTGNTPLVNTGVVSPSAQMSSLKHNNPSEFLSNILTTYTNATVKAQTYGEGSQEILINSRANSLDRRAKKVNFLNAMGNIRRDTVGNVFTLGDLMALDPDCVHVIKALHLSTAERLNTNYVGATQDWAASDLETQMATMVGNSIPSLMASLNIDSIMFSSTNRTVGGTLVTIVSDSDSATGEDLTVPNQIFTNRFNSEIVPILSSGGMMDFQIVVQSSLMGDTFIRISLMGQPEVPYVTPTYCSSIVTPIMTTNRDLIRNTASQMTAFFNELGITSSYSSPTPTVIAGNMGANTGGMISASSMV